MSIKSIDLIEPTLLTTQVITVRLIILKYKHAKKISWAPATAASK